MNDELYINPMDERIESGIRRLFFRVLLVVVVFVIPVVSMIWFNRGKS